MKSRNSTTRELSEICDCHCYRVECENPGQYCKDNFGSPNLRLVRNEELYEASRNKLREIYNNSNINREERREAGEGLHYSSIRILLHEYLVSARNLLR